MSDLKYKTLEELKDEKKSLSKAITEQLDWCNGMKERLRWIDKYIERKEKSGDKGSGDN